MIRVAGLVGIGVLGLTGCGQPMPLEETVLSTDPLYAYSIGSGPVTVVVLHGGPGLRHDYLRPEFDRMASNARVVYYDQRGCGRSTPNGPYAWNQHVGDLHDLLTTSLSSDRIVLAASSWGTILAILYAYYHPERVAGLVLSGVVGWPDAPSRLPPLRTLLDTMRVLDHSTGRLVEIDSLTRNRPLALSRQGNPLDSVRAGGPSFTRIDSATVASNQGRNLGRELAARLGASCPTVGRLVWDGWETAPLLDSLTSVHAPTLIVHGSEGRETTPALQLAEAFPWARRAVITGGGHDPWFTQPDQFFETVLEFVRGIGSSR